MSSERPAHVQSERRDVIADGHAQSAGQLLDVREPFEFEVARIEGANLIPLGELPGRVGELDREKEILVLCHSGMRSAQAAEFLQQAGFARVANVAGGIDAWSTEIDPDVPRY